MDILGLPDVFLRDLMRKMTIKDRLRLRLICRAFEELVAGTHAGYFNEGFICSFVQARLTSVPPIRKHITEMLAVNFGDVQFKTAVQSAEELIHIFNGITFAKVNVNVADSIPLDMIQKMMENFKIGEISFVVDTETQFRNALLLMEDSPSSKHVVWFKYLPDRDIFLALPRVEEVHIISKREISSEIFFQLTSTQNTLHLHYTCTWMDLDELRRLIQVISSNNHEQTVRFGLNTLLVVLWMEKAGIKESSMAGDMCREFELIYNRKTFENNVKTLVLRYKQCWISIVGFDWTGTFRSEYVDVSMSNRETSLE